MKEPPMREVYKLRCRHCEYTFMKDHRLIPWGYIRDAECPACHKVGGLEIRGCVRFRQGVLDDALADSRRESKVSESRQREASDGL